MNHQRIKFQLILYINVDRIEAYAFFDKNKHNINFKDIYDYKF